MGAARGKIVPLSLNRNGDVATEAPTEAALRQHAEEEFGALLAWVQEQSGTFFVFEKALIPRVYALACVLISLFLCRREAQERAALAPQVKVGRKVFDRRPAQPRNLSTYFGVVRYWRTYLRGPKSGKIREGFHPLDAKVGLTADRVTMHLATLGARLATKLSYAQTHAVLGWFLSQPPSTEVIEKTVLGLGYRTPAWFEEAPAPEGDGEVLVIQIDGKAAPTATDQELARRRGKRRKTKGPKSKRHRGRQKRQRLGKKPRRKKGDKSKNGKVATVVVMYTLKRAGGRLVGPINRWVYASFAPKRHAFAIARREADKRGFTAESGKLVQVVTDGDDDLAIYTARYFPEAKHTIDVMHVIEYIWKAGKVLFREGSSSLQEWVDVQKDRLYRGKVCEIIAELNKQHSQLPNRGYNAASRRRRLDKVIGYLTPRATKMDYDKLLKQDLEIGSGAVEGAIKHVVGQRFDQGGMRWIKTRAEALLQLRCIETNGDWDRFVDKVHGGLLKNASRRGIRTRLLNNSPQPLQNLAEAA